MVWQHAQCIMGVEVNLAKETTKAFFFLLSCTGSQVLLKAHFASEARTPCKNATVQVKNVLLDRKAKGGILFN